jgi:hypothetical protein
MSESNTKVVVEARGGAGRVRPRWGHHCRAGRQISVGGAQGRVRVGVLGVGSSPVA